LAFASSSAFFLACSSAAFFATASSSARFWAASSSAYFFIAAASASCFFPASAALLRAPFNVSMMLLVAFFPSASVCAFLVAAVDPAFLNQSPTAFTAFCVSSAPLCCFTCCLAISSWATLPSPWRISSTTFSFLALACCSSLAMFFFSEPPALPPRVLSSQSSKTSEDTWPEVILAEYFP